MQMMRINFVWGAVYIDVKPQNLTSHRLNCLKTCGLATVKKQDRMAIYRIADPEIDKGSLFLS